MGTARALVVAAVVCLVPLRADADAAKAWTAAKASLPATTEVLIGLTITQLTKTRLFSMAFPLLMSREPEIKDGLDLVKSRCGIDPLETIEGVVVGTDKDQKQGALFLAVRGLDQAKLVTCLESLARSKGPKDAQVVVTKDGLITEITMGTDKVYLSWIGKDVLVLPIDFDDKAQLQAWTGGKKRFAKGPAGKLAAKLDTRAALWGVSTVPQELDGTKMKSGYGTLTAASGNLTADLHILLTSPADAQATADKATRELQTLASGTQLAANLRTMLQQVAVTAVAAEVVVKAIIAEKDLLALGGALLGGP